MVVRHRGLETGQTTPEYAGMLLVVAAVLVALTATAPTLAGPLARDAAHAFCAVATKLGLGGDCSAGSTADGPPWACTKQSDNGEADANITVFDINLGGKVQYLKEQRSDGTWEVTLKLGGQAGLKDTAGGGATVETGGPASGSGEGGGGTHDAGGGESGSGSLGFEGEAGATWDFTSEAAANHFIHQAELAAGEASFPVLGSLANIVQRAIGDGWNPGTPTKTYLQGGVSASVSGLLGAAGLDLDASALLGVMYDTGSHAYTVYFGLDGSVASTLGLPVFSGSADGSAHLALEFDPNTMGGGYHPATLTLTADGTVAAGPAGDNTWKTLEDVTKAERTPLSGSHGVGATFTAQLELTDPANLGAAEAFIDALRAANLHDTLSAGAQLVHLFDQTGYMSLATYASSSSAFGGNASVGNGEVTFGLGGQVSSTHEKLLDASYRPPGGSFVDWPACRS